MSDGEVEVESPSGYAILPKDVTDEIGSVKLFNKWSYEDVEIRDISLTYAPALLCSFRTVAAAIGGRRDRHARGARLTRLQRLHPDPHARLHLTLGRPLCRQAIQEGPVPHH
jgi:hypothetical protein